MISSRDVDYAARRQGFDSFDVQEHGVAAIIFDKDKENVLLGLKDPESKRVMAGQWMLPGGRVKSGENIIETLIREMKEELGITVTGYRHIHTQVSRMPTMGHVQVDFVEVLSYEGEIEVNPEEDLVDVKFIPRKAIWKEIGRWAFDVTQHKLFAFIDGSVSYDEMKGAHIQ